MILTQAREPLACSPVLPEPRGLGTAGCALLSSPTPTRALGCCKTRGED